MEKESARLLSPAALAFYGDSVYETLVRRFIVEKGNRPSRELHKMSVEMARASFQAAAFDRLLPELGEEEADILRRGRNTTGITAPKSSNPAEYHKATAVEALFGYLSLIGEEKRLHELFGHICGDERR